MAGQVVAVQLVVALLVVGLSLLFAIVAATQRVEDAAAAKVLNIATALAASEEVRRGLASSDPAASLRDAIERQRVATGTDFIVVMSVDGVRYTHPTPERVGKLYNGTIAPAQAGGTVVENYTGSLGPSTRAVVPVREGGRLTGLVSVGLRRERAAEALRGMVPQIVLPGVAAAVLSGLGAWAVARQVRADTLGLNAAELRRLHAEAHETNNRMHTMVMLMELGDTESAIKLATGELGSTQLRRASVAQAVASAIEEPAVAMLLQRKAEEAAGRGVRFELDPDAHLPRGVLSGGVAVTLVGNLIDNALDAAASSELEAVDPWVTVDLAVDAEQVVLTVADNGPGLPAELVASAFERGWTTKESDAPGGRGVGLALVRQLVAERGGTIAVSEPPGAVFTVTLPRKDADG